MYLLGPLLLLVVVVCSTQPDAGLLYSNLQRFEDRNTLLNSFFWLQLILGHSKGIAEHNVIFLEDSKTILVPSDKDLFVLRFPFFKKPQRDISFMEIDLGEDVRSVGSEFFPLATASAEYSSSSVTIEREVSHARSISFNPSVLRALKLAKTGFALVLNLGETSAVFTKEAITCTADPGGRVQLQVTNAMVHFPNARTRVVRYKHKKNQMENQPWAAVESHLADEKHVGALFYENFRLGRHRCVTNTSYFEDSSSRKWIEWNMPWSV